MSHYYALELYTPDNSSSEQSEFSSLLPGIKPRLEEAGLVINHGLLVGEILGVEVNPAIALLDEINRANRLFEECYAQAESPPSILYEEDINVLSESFTEILEQLKSAIDDGGQPRGTGGERLLTSELVGENPDGQLYLQSRHVELLKLKTHLEDLCSFLKFANAQNFLLKIEI